MQDRAVDYKLFSMLQSMSFLTKDNVRFVYKKHPQYGNLTRPRLLELYNENCKDSKDLISLSTIGRKLRLFKSIGMMSEEFVIDRFGKRVAAYVLLENYRTYQYIPLDTLQYLANTASSSVIKIYAYLLNKHIYKQKFNQFYSFTLQELAEQIGITDFNNGNTRRVKDCLNSLLSVDLISYAEYYVTIDSGVPSPRMRLTSANQHYKKLIK